MSVLRTTTATGIGFALMISASAFAGPVTFNFNDVASSSSSAIATSMTNALHAALYGTSSATVSGAFATNSYSGDGHVVGPTLGTSNGATGMTDTTHSHAPPNDYFIINNNQGSSHNDAFTLTFTNFYITSISFDWEIFPDASCQITGSATACSSGAAYPDMTVYADDVLLSTPLIVSTKPSTADSFGQKDPQGIGVSGPIATLALTGVLSNGAQKLTFKDWPAEVGIDNLVIEGCAYWPCTPPQQQVPEPPPLLLFGLAFGILGFLRNSGRSRSKIA